MKNKTLIYNVSLTFLANVISLLVSLFSTLFIPKFVTTSDYGYWQLYLFYISYAGILHLGLCDGIYLTNGGKEYSQLNYQYLRGEFYTLICYLLMFCLLIFGVTNLLPLEGKTKIVVSLTCIGAFIHVAKTYLLMILQATNRLKEYSLVTIADRTVFILDLLSFFFVFPLTNSFQGIITCDICGRIVSLIIAITYTKEIICGRIPKFKVFYTDLKNNIIAGSSLLLAGIASNLIVGIIRYSIKQQWDITEFAKISLSLSVINMILSFINIAAIVFFPILKRMDPRNQRSLYKEFETVLISFSLFVLCFAGIAKVLVSAWLPQYSDSLYYMIFLFPICVFESETSMLLNTYLKALRFEKKILRYNIISVFLSLIDAFIFTVLIKNIFGAIIGVLVVLAFRDLCLKRVIYKYFGFVDMNKFICQELIMICLYIISYKISNIAAGSVIYLGCFLAFVFVNKNNVFNYLKQVKKRI